MPGLRRTGPRLRQLEASGHADAVAEWVCRRFDINNCWRRDETFRTAHVVYLKQKEELRPTLVIPPGKSTTLRGDSATGHGAGEGHLTSASGRGPKTSQPVHPDAPSSNRARRSPESDAAVAEPYFEALEGVWRGLHVLRNYLGAPASAAAIADSPQLECAPSSRRRSTGMPNCPRGI